MLTTVSGERVVRRSDTVYPSSCAKWPLTGSTGGRYSKQLSGKRRLMRFLWLYDDDAALQTIYRALIAIKLWQLYNSVNTVWDKAGHYCDFTGCMLTSPARPGPVISWPGPARWLFEIIEPGPGPPGCPAGAGP